MLIIIRLNKSIYNDYQYVLIYFLVYENKYLLVYMKQLNIQLPSHSKSNPW